MARELEINIRTTANTKALKDLSESFKELERSLNVFDNKTYLQGLESNLTTFKSQISEVTAEVRELGAALDALGGNKGIKGFQQALGKGINVNLKGARVAYKDLETIAAETEQTVKRTAAEEQRRVSIIREQGRQKRLNERSEAKIKAQEDERNEANKRAAAETNAELKEREQIQKRVVVGMRTIEGLEEKQQQLSEKTNIQMRRYEMALERYTRAQQRMRDTAGTARPSDMQAINTDLSEAKADLKQVINALQGAQTQWNTYGRSVERNIQKTRELIDATRDQISTLQKKEQAERASGRASAADDYLRMIDQQNSKLTEQVAIVNRLQRLVTGGRVSRQLPGGATMTYDMLGSQRTYREIGDTISRSRGQIQQLNGTQEAYKNSVQEVRVAEAQRAAQMRESIASMQRFANQIRSVMAALSQFAATLRSRVNTALNGFGSNLTGITRNASSRFASLRAQLDATGNSFIGFGRKSTQGVSQAEMALNNFFSAGWAMLASGGVVSMFGRNIFGNMMGGLQDYMVQELNMVRLGISGGVWDFAQEPTQLLDGRTVRAGERPYAPGDIRPLQDLIFGIQSGAFSEAGRGLTAFNAAELTDALYYFSSAIGANLTGSEGVATARALEPLLRIASVTQTPVETMIKGTLNTMMEFGYDPRAIIGGAVDGTGTTAMFDQVAAMIAVASNVSSMEVQDVFEAFKMMGPALHRLTGATEGAGLEDAMAAIFLASEVGLKGGNVGRGLDRLVTQLLDPDGPMADVITKYFGDDATIRGMFFDDQGYLKGGLRGVFDTLINSELSDPQLASMMGELFTQNAARVGIGILDPDKLRADADTAGSWAWFQEMIEEDRLTQFMSTAAMAMENTVSASFTNLGNSWNMVKTMIVTSVREDLINAFNELANVIWDIGYAIRDNPALGRFVAYFATIIGGITALVGGMMVFSGTILLVARAFHMLGGMVAPVMQMLAILPSLLLTMAPAFLLVAGAATALYIAWDRNLGNMQNRFNDFMDKFTWDNVLSTLADVTTWAIRVGRAFEELIGGVFMGVDMPLNNLQALLQDLMGVPLGDRLFGELIGFGADLEKSFKGAKEEGAEGFFASIRNGARTADTVLSNLSGSVRGISELFAFGQTTQGGANAITALGTALGIEQPLVRAAQAMMSLRAALSALRGIVAAAVGEWRQFFDALSQTTSLGDVLSTVFTSALAAIGGFVVGLVTVFGRLATVGSLALRTMNEGFDGLVTRMRTAAATLSSGGGIGQVIARSLQIAANAVERFGGIIDQMRARFQTAGASIQGVAAAVGAAIGAAMGVRLIAMLTPGLGMLLRFGTMLGQVGVWALQAAAQFAIFGARVAVALATALIQIGLLIGQLLVSAAAWGAETLAKGLNAAATGTQVAANTGLIASLAGVVGAMIAGVAATGTLTGAFTALNLAALPISAIIGAIVLAVAALPVAFFGTAAAIFVVVSATDGLRAGFSAVIDFFQAFWAVASNLRFVIMALGGAFQLAMAPINALLNAVGVNLPVIEMLGYAFGAAALIIGGAFAGSLLLAASPFLIMAGAIYIGIEAVKLFVENWRWMYDMVAAILGGLDSIFESSFNFIGDKIDWLIGKIQPLIDVLDRLASFAGIDISVSEDGRSITVGLPGTDASITAPTNPLEAGAALGEKVRGLWGGKPLAEVVADSVAPYISETISGWGEMSQAEQLLMMEKTLGEVLMLRSGGWQALNAGSAELNPTQAGQGIFSTRDLNWLANQSTETFMAYMTSSQDDIARRGDPEGRLSGADRWAIAELADAAESMYAAQVRAGTSPTVAQARISSAVQNQIMDGTYDPQTEMYVANQVASLAAEQYNQGQREAMQALDETISSVYATPGVTNVGTTLAATAAETGETAGGVAITTEAPSPYGPDRPSLYQQSVDLVKDIIGPEASDQIITMLEGFGFDLETGTLNGLEVNDAAFYDPETAWMMEALFPGWDEYQSQLSEYGKFMAMVESLGRADAEREWVESYGTAPPSKPDSSVAFGDGSLEENVEDVQKAIDDQKAFIESITSGLSSASFLVEDFASGMQAIFGRTSGAAGFGAYAETIMGNIPEETLEANPWFNVDELLANAAISGGYDQATTTTAGKNLHKILRPMLERTAAELGVSMDDLLTDVPQYYFDPSLMATAQSSMFSALTRIGPEQGAILDSLGITPDAQSGRVFEEMGLDWAELTQYAISNAMAGNDWDLSHYLMDAWDISQAEAQAYIAQNGLDSRVISDATFGAVEAAVMSSGGQVAAMTQEWWVWAAEATQNGADMLVDITRSEFEKIPEAARIVMSNQGIMFNIIDDESVQAEVSMIESALAQIEGATGEMARLLSSPGVSVVNALSLTDTGGAGGSLYDLPGLGNVEQALNFNAMITLGLDGDDATNGLRETYDVATNTYTILNEVDGTEVVIPAPEYDAFKKGMTEVEEILKEKYQKYHDANDPVWGSGDMYTGGEVEVPMTFEEWIRAGAEGLIDENGNLVLPKMSAEESASAMTGGIDWVGGISVIQENGAKAAQAFQTSWSNSMESDTEIPNSIKNAIETAMTDMDMNVAPAAQTFATEFASQFQTALALALGAGEGDAVWGSGDMYTGGTPDAGAASPMAENIILGLTTALSSATIDVSGFITNLQTAIQTGVDGITVDLTTFGTSVTASASEWGATAGAAFAAAFAAASSPGGGGGAPVGADGQPASYGPGGGVGFVNDAGPAVPQTITTTITADASQFYTEITSVNNILMSVGLATVSPQVWLNGTVFFAGMMNVNTELTNVGARVVAPTVNLNDNASIALSSILTSLNSIASTFTATVNIVTNGSVPDVGNNATGGRINYGENLTWVGEEGPELVRLGTGSHVYSNPVSMRMADESMLTASPFTNTKGLASQTTNNVSVSVQINNPQVRNDGDIDRLAREVSKRLGKEIDAMMNGQRPRSN